MTENAYDWYFENVVVAGRPAKPGPARQRQLAWADAAERLRGTSDVVDLALSQGFVVTCAQAAAGGLSYADLRRLVRRNEWSSPRRGVLAVLPGSADTSQPHGHSPEVRASAVALLTGTVISSECAASAYGLPLLDQPLRSRVTTRPFLGSGRATTLLRPARLDRDEVTSWFGADITTVSRTVIDLSRHGARQGLVAADAALHERLCTHAELAAVIARARRWPGVRTARRVLALACAKVESPLESLVRLAIDDAKLPLPVPQRVVRTQWGRYRVDGLWADRAVALEVDGMLKYRTADNGPSPLVEEKRRQEHLERSGYLVVRVTWADLLQDLPETLRRVEWALQRGGQLRAA